MQVLSWEYDGRAIEHFMFEAFNRHGIVCLQSVPKKLLGKLKTWFATHHYFCHIQSQICSETSPYLVTAYRNDTGGIAFALYYNQFGFYSTLSIEERKRINFAEEPNMIEYLKCANYGRIHETSCLIVRTNGYTILNTILGDGKSSIVKNLQKFLCWYDMERMFIPKNTVIACGVIFSSSLEYAKKQKDVLKKHENHIGILVEKLTGSPAFVIANRC